MDLILGAAGKALLARLKELLRPLLVKALSNTLAPAQLRNRVFATQAYQYHADFLFRAVPLACRAADLADMGFGRTLRPGF
jgi:hypothetical protein